LTDGRWECGVSFHQHRTERGGGSALLWADIVAKVGEGQLVRNDRIAASKSLNQPCTSTAHLEAMLLPRTPKIVLQQYRPEPEMPMARPKRRR
jgi:hypothetical protein